MFFVERVSLFWSIHYERFDCIVCVFTVYAVYAAHTVDPLIATPQIAGTAFVDLL